ncbi:acetamidase/formamidase family protein [Microbacterium sp. NPDC003461]
MTTHRIPLASENLHGSFSPSHPPILTIRPGDTVTFPTLDGDWLTDVEIGPPARHGGQWPGRRPGVDDGHALIGPLAIAGAEPGMTLAVRIDDVQPGEWGWSRSGGRAVELDTELAVDEGAESYLRWTLDSPSSMATSQHGHRVRMRPFLGVIGCAPAAPGSHSTHPPRSTGGNIDCRELIAGTTLFLPIEAPGALLSVGDGHAAQGDGEAGSTAIECPMRSVTLTVDLVRDMPLSMPRALTPESWITFGFAETLDAAAFQALSGMVDLLQERTGFTRKESLNLASQTTDLRVTQIVNGVKGVHAVLDHDALALLGGRAAV